MLLKTFGLVLLFFVLIWATRFVISGFNSLVKGLPEKSKLAVAAIFIALSTSLPELFVTLAASFEGRSEIALATLLGSNVADLSIIIGGGTLIAGSLPIVGTYWRYELAATFLAGVAPILLMMDGALSRLDGIILLIIYLIYVEEIVIDGKRKTLAKTGAVKHGIFDHLRLWHRNGQDIGLVKLVLGLVALMVSADLIVRLAVDLASVWKVTTVLVGLLVVSVGTSLPELVLSAGAVAKKSVALVLGNILGSVVTNATLLVGLAAVIRPFRIATVDSYALVNVAFVVIFGLFWIFTSTRRSLSRFEGLLLVGLFLCFTGLQLFLSVP